MLDELARPRAMRVEAIFGIVKRCAAESCRLWWKERGDGWRCGHGYVRRLDLVMEGSVDALPRIRHRSLSGLNEVAAQVYRDVKHQRASEAV